MRFKGFVIAFALAGAQVVSMSGAFGAPDVVAPVAPKKELVATRPSAPSLETAETLVKALTRRGMDLQARVGTTTPAEDPRLKEMRVAAGLDKAPAHPPRLASRLSAAATRRVGAPLAQPTDLAGYVKILSRTSPGGVVTGKFYDWRSPSIYRIFGGLHNGYDIALAAGKAVVAGWSGRISAITHWYGSEYGITVVSPAGFQTTYGHLAPSVRVGTWVEPGDILGTVCRDHVDIKMKDARGRYIDFARSVPLLAVARPAVEAAVAGATIVPAPPPLLGPAWTQKPDAVRAALSYMRFRVQEASLVGTDAPPTALALVRRQVSDARSRLLLHGVPEEVLLAAFAEIPAMSNGTLSMGDPAPKAGVDLLGDWLSRQQLLGDVRKAVPQLKSLLKDLNAEALE